MNIYDRIEYIYKTLGLNAGQFFAKAGLSPQIFANSKNRGTLPSSETLLKLKTTYPDISIEYILTGEGKPFKSDNEIPQQFETKNVMFIKNLVASAGGSINTDEEEDVVFLSLKYVPKNSVALKVVGDSMNPLINEGDIIIGKPLEYMAKMIEGKIYIVVTVLDGITVKRYKQSSDVNKIILVSENKEYSEIEYDKHQIRRIYEVVRVVKNII